MIKGSGHPPIDKTCLYCKKVFQVKYKKRKQKCCSLRCTSLYGWSLPNHRRSKTMICQICNKKFQEIPSRIKDGKGKYCSRICYTISMKQGNYPHTMSEESKYNLSQKRIGKLNPAYIHGHNDTHIRYMAGFTRKLRNYIKTRDGFKCVKCGDIKLLDVHHIDHNPLHNVPENLITWCRSCHMSHHKNPKQFSNYSV